MVRRRDRKAPAPPQAAADDVCEHCQRQTEYGIVCDECGTWSCPACLNEWLPSSCPPSLYVALSLLKEFPFVCPVCNPAFNLPQQLLRAKVNPRGFAKAADWLVSLGVDRRVLECPAGQTKALKAVLLSERIRFSALHRNLTERSDFERAIHSPDASASGESSKTLTPRQATPLHPPPAPLLNLPGSFTITTTTATSTIAATVITGPLVTFATAAMTELRPSLSFVGAPPPRPLSFNFNPRPASQVSLTQAWDNSFLHSIGGPTAGVIARPIPSFTSAFAPPWQPPSAVTPAGELVQGWNTPLPSHPTPQESASTTQAWGFGIQGLSHSAGQPPSVNQPPLSVFTQQTGAASQLVNFRPPPMVGQTDTGTQPSFQPQGHAQPLLGISSSHQAWIPPPTPQPELSCSGPTPPHMGWQPSPGHSTPSPFRPIQPAGNHAIAQPSPIDGALASLFAQQMQLLQQQQQMNERLFSQHPSVSHRSETLRLPKAKFHNFTGEQTDWPAWWNWFKTMVHENPDLSKQGKMDALTQCLEGGKAEKKVAAFCRLATNYDDAIGCLVKSFGSSLVLQRDLWRHLHGLPNIKSDYSNLEDVHDDIHAKTALLRTSGTSEDVLNQFASLYVEKQPVRLQEAFHMHRTVRGTVESPWTVVELLDVLGSLLNLSRTRSSSSAQHSGGGGGSGGGHSRSPHNPQTTFHPSHHRGSAQKDSNYQQPPFSMQMVQHTPNSRPPHQSNFQSRSSSNQRAPLKRCDFCQSTGSHWSSECGVYGTPDKRRARAMALRLCLNCLRGNEYGKGHMVSSCPSKKNCVHCQRRHHSAIHESADRPKPPSKPSVKLQTTAPSGSGTRGVRKPQATPQLMATGKDDGKDDSDFESYFSPLPDHQCAASSSEKGCLDAVKMLAFSATIVNPRTGEETAANVFLDNGSKTNFVHASFVNNFPNLPVIGEMEKKPVGVFGSNQIIEKESQLAELILRAPNGAELKLCAFTVDILCPDITIRPLEMSDNDAAIVRSQRCLNTPPIKPFSFRPHLLIGEEDFNSIMNARGSSKLFLEGSLRIHITPFGNLLDGSREGSMRHKRELDKAKMRQESGHFYNKPLGHQLILHSFEEDLGKPAVDTVENLFKSYMVGVEEEKTKADAKAFEDKVIQAFQSNIRLVTMPDGKQRYEVGLLWKEPVPEDLPDSFPAAYACTQRVLRKLCPDGKDLTRLKQYNAPFDVYKERGMLEVIPPEEVGYLSPKFAHLSQASHPPPNAQPPRITWWLQHFPVYKESSSFTKVRAVLNAAFRVGNVSLNDLLNCGPDLMAKMLNLLLAVREPPVAVIYDLEKAYLSCSLRKEDRDAVRIIWVKNINNPTLIDNVELSRFTVVPFGLPPSGFLLHLCLGYHLKSNPGEITDRIRHRYYQDNFITPSTGGRDAMKLYKEAKVLFAKAGFNLREWASNDPEFNASIPTHDRHPGLDKDEKEIGVLGLRWMIETDKFAFPKHSESTRKLYERIAEEKLWTKRLLCTFVAKLGWDPLGYVAPCTIAGRLLIQRAWLDNLPWDLLFPDELQEESTKVIGGFFLFHLVEWPRRMVQDHRAPVILVALADASEKAICGAVYVWQRLKENISSHLALAKSKNALKGKEAAKPRRTMPELELNSFVLAVRAALFLRDTLELRVTEIHLMGDSRIALYQCKAAANLRRLPAYVQRRCDEVNDAGVILHYIPTELNVSDRGTRTSDLSAIDIDWLQGPEIIRTKGPSEWPVFDEEDVGESMPALLQLTDDPAEVEQSSWLGLEASKFSSLQRLVAVTAWVLRAVDCFKKGGQKRLRHLTAWERTRALYAWVAAEQAASFSSTMKELKKGRSDRLGKELDLFIDEKRILRLGGRLDLSPLSLEAKHPALIEKKRDFTNLVILFHHIKVGHGKPRATLNSIRNTFWITRGSNETKQVIRMLCNHCRMLKGKALKAPKMGTLPIERVTPGVCWAHLGIDGAGPFTLRIKFPSGNSLESISILIISCLWSRAVSLEPIWGAGTAEEVLLSLQRHIGSHGKPVAIWSDNAPGFVKAGEMLSREHITWHHTPPTAAWAAGCWEILVKLTKNLLKVQLWRKTVDHSVFTALLANTEAIINTRPICPVKDSTFAPGDEVLTPAHFISPSHRLDAPLLPGPTDPDPDYLPDSSSATLAKGFTKSQKTMQQSREFYVKHYLQELRIVHRTNFANRHGAENWKPQVGKVYLLLGKGDRQNWRRCKVLELLPGPDKEIRFVRILLANQRGGPGFVTVRGTQQLIPLEAELGEESVEEEKDEKTLQPPPLRVKLNQRSSSPTPNRAEMDSEADSDEEVTTPKSKQPPTHHSYNTRSKNKVITMMTNIFCLMLLASSGHATPVHYSPSLPRTATICPDRGGISIISVGQFENSNPDSCIDNDKPIQTIKVSLFEWQPDFPVTEAVICSQQTRRICTSTTFFGTQGISKLPSTSYEAISPEECRQTNATGVWRETALKSNSINSNVFTTGKDLVAAYGWFQEVCTSVVNLEMERTMVMSRTGEKLETGSNVDLSACAPANGACIASNTVIVWQPAFWKEHCPWRFKSTHDATRIGNSVHIEELELVLTIKGPATGATDDCLPNGSEMTHQNWAVRLKGIHPHSANSSQRLLKRRQLKPDYLDAKVNFAMSKIELMFKKQLHRLTCQIQTMETKIALAFLMANPAEGVRFVTGRDDLTAEWEGKDLVVRVCQRVNITKIYENHRVLHKCFLFTPVQVEGHDELLYLANGSGELCAESPEIHCDDLPARPAAKRNLDWSSLSLHESLKTLMKASQLPFLARPPTILTNMNIPLAATIAWARRMPRYVESVNSLIHYSTSIHGNSSFARDVIKEIGTTAIAIGNNTIRMVTHLGDSAIHGATHVTDGLFNTFESVLHQVGVYIGWLLASVVSLGLIWALHSSGAFKRCKERLKKKAGKDEAQTKIKQILRSDRGRKTEGREEGLSLSLLKRSRSLSTIQKQIDEKDVPRHIASIVDETAFDPDIV